MEYEKNLKQLRDRSITVYLWAELSFSDYEQTMFLNAFFRVLERLRNDEKYISYKCQHGCAFEIIQNRVESVEYTVK